MSKRDLKKYLNQLTKSSLKSRFSNCNEIQPCKVYYNFVFNPKEETLLQECKFKIWTNTFRYKRPPRNAKPKKCVVPLSRSISSNFITLGVDPFVIADVMLYNIEIQAFSSENTIKQELFLKVCSILLNKQSYLWLQMGLNEFKSRINAIHKETITQKWKTSPNLTQSSRFEYWLP
jgi:hypothetical protein